MIKAILFDLDGTLLPMDRSVFESAYMGSLAQMAAGRGYDPKDFLRALGKSIAAMAQNDGSLPNGDVFWNTFAEASGKSRETEEPAFQIYYETDYQKLEAVCGKNPAALLAVKALRQKGYTLAIATNPVFPVIGIESRLAWAGCDKGDFALLTTIENSRFTKPHGGYYRDVAEALGVLPEECLMVGNDVSDDMPAERAGMRVFLLTDCLENPKGEDCARYPQGGFSELLAYIEERAKED